MLARFWLPFFLLLAGCAPNQDDPQGLLIKLENSWAQPERLLVEVDGEGRLLSQRAEVAKEGSRTLLILDGDRAKFSASDPGADMPFAEFRYFNGKVRMVGAERKVDSLRSDLVKASVRAGMMGAAAVMAGALTGEKNPSRRIQIWNLKWIGPEKIDGRDAIVLQHHLRIQGQREVLAVCRVWIDPKTHHPIRREFQSGEGKDKAVSVEIYRRFEPEPELPDDLWK